jgi:hypothetical protein
MGLPIQARRAAFTMHKVVLGQEPKVAAFCESLGYGCAFEEL